MTKKKAKPRRHIIYAQKQGTKFYVFVDSHCFEVCSPRGRIKAIQCAKSLCYLFTSMGLDYELWDELSDEWKSGEKR